MNLVLLYDQKTKQLISFMVLSSGKPRYPPSTVFPQKEMIQLTFQILINVTAFVYMTSLQMSTVHFLMSTSPCESPFPWWFFEYKKGRVEKSWCTGWVLSHGFSTRSLAWPGLDESWTPEGRAQRLSLITNVSLCFKKNPGKKSDF